MGITVGIDLGTTFSAVACIGAEGKPVILKNSLGASTTPSVVAIERDGSVLFGEEAKESQLMGNESAASFYKRNMGEKGFEEDIYGMRFDATDFSAIFLRKLLADISAANNISIDAAVVTVPAYFKAAQREATQEALTRTGVTALGVLNEPSAAAYAYGLTGADTEKTVLVYDLGGGTFDVTIARISKKEIRVLASDGNHMLGGREWDAALTRLLLDLFCEQRGLERDELELSLADTNSLAVLSEKIKHDLTARQRARARVSIGGATEIIEVSRGDFEDVSSYYLGLTIDLCEQALHEARLTWRDLDGIVLVGGSTRMPQVHDYLAQATGKKPYGGVNPDEAVALGAAVYAQTVAERSLINQAGRGVPSFVLSETPRLVDCTAHAMGMIAESPDRKCYENSVIIPKNASIPIAESRDYLLKVPSWRKGSLEVYVLQGSEPAVFDNDVVGKYVIKGIEHEGGIDSKVRVTYSYNENTTIEVAAEQPAVGRPLEVERAELEEDLSRFLRSPIENDSVEPEIAPMRIMLCIDTSGSMWDEGFIAASDAINRFLDTVQEAPIEVGLMCFADQSGIVCPMGSNPETLRQAATVESLHAVALGFGNNNDPLASYETWLNGNTGMRNCLLVLTDGQWSSDACNSARKASRRLKAAETVIIGIGVAHADLAFLRQISTSDDYASLLDLSQLGETFTSIGRSIASGSSINL